MRGKERGKCACGECEDFMMEQLGAVVVVCRLAIVNENTQGEEERGD